MLTATDLLTTCGEHEERLVWVSPGVEANAHVFVEKVNALLLMFGETRKLTSGFRDILVQRELVRLKKARSLFSWHELGVAADIEDMRGALGKWVLSHENALAVCGLYAEHPDATKLWVHVQSAAPASGRRIFWP